MQMAATTAAAVQRLVELGGRGLRTGGDMELEARLSRQKGLSRQDLDAILTKFESSGFEEETPWTETHDYFYRVQLPCGVANGGPPHGGKTEAVEVRSTMQPDIDDLKLRVNHIAKQRKSMAVLAGASDQCWKIVLSKEVPLEASVLPQVATPHLVRIKQRRSFVYRSARSGLSWRFDFTLSFSGTTKTEAEQRQQREDATFEFEVELLDAHVDLSDAYIAESLVMKLQDFVPSLHVASQPRAATGK